jgi:hypothetical protein
MFGQRVAVLRFYGVAGSDLEGRGNGFAAVHDEIL